MAKRYYPRGYIGTEAAIIRIAEATHPERWDRRKFLLGEPEIWDGLGVVYNAQFIEDLLRVRLLPDQQRATTDWVERLVDFREARDDLRRALNAGDLVAKYVDENGVESSVARLCWGSDQAEEALETGGAWISVSSITEARRLLLISESELGRFIANRRKGIPEARLEIGETIPDATDPPLNLDGEPAPALAAAAGSKHLSTRETHELISQYVSSESAAGRSPTKSGAERYVRHAAAGRQVSRSLVREILSEHLQSQGKTTKRGRPKKAP
jgi:hypothetical protein